MEKGQISDKEIYDMYLISRSLGGQPREEAVIEVSDHLCMSEDDVKAAIDRYRASNGMKPIEW